jgi:hypothetical protein
LCVLFTSTFLLLALTLRLLLAAVIIAGTLITSCFTSLLIGTRFSARRFITWLIAAWFALVVTRLRAVATTIASAVVVAVMTTTLRSVATFVTTRWRRTAGLGFGFNIAADTTEEEAP